MQEAARDVEQAGVVMSSANDGSPRSDSGTSSCDSAPAPQAVDASVVVPTSLSLGSLPSPSSGLSRRASASSPTAPDPYNGQLGDWRRALAHMPPVTCRDQLPLGQPLSSLVDSDHAVPEVFVAVFDRLDQTMAAASPDVRHSWWSEPPTDNGEHAIENISQMTLHAMEADLAAGLRAYASAMALVHLLRSLLYRGSSEALLRTDMLHHVLSLQELDDPKLRQTMFSVVLSPLAPWTRLLITWLLLRLTQLGTTCGLVLRSVCAFFGPVLSRSASETAREQATSCLEVLLSNVEHIIPPPTYHRPTTDRPRDSLPCDHRGAANRQRRDRHVVLLHFGSALLHHSGERFDSGGVVGECLFLS